MSVTRRLALQSGISALLAGPALAQSSQADETLAVLTDIADALGMIRGVQREWRSINRIFYVGSGSIRLSDGGVREASRIMTEMSFTQRANRIDVTNDSGRTIEVARGEIAWNETEPGIGATPAANPAGRTWRNVTVPQGAVRAALEDYVADAGSVELGRAGPHQQVAFDTAEGRVSMLIGPDRRPFRINLRSAAGEIVTDVSEYRDFEKLGVWFPAHLRRSSGGEVFETITVSEYRSNPYVIFPVPPALRSAGGASATNGGQHG